MSYPSCWKGSPEQDSLKGIANFTIDGHEFAIELSCFEDYRRIASMLDLAFSQGKAFASEVLRAQIDRALDAAALAHKLPPYG